jgi:hypothetical protein
VTLQPVQLLLYRFGPNAHFEGQLVGALERIETGGGMRIRDALFVQRDGETSELAIVDLRGNMAGGIVTRLLGFRLDPADRRLATERALAGPAAETLRALGDTLDPGWALAAVLVEHVWMGALEDAVSRIGGTALANDVVGATTLADLGPDLLAATRAGARAASP